MHISAEGADLADFSLEKKKGKGETLRRPTGNERSGRMTDNCLKQK